MNILFLSELLYPHAGGAQLATHLWAELLAKSGFNIKIVTNRSPNEPVVSKYDNVTIYRIPLLKSHESIKYCIVKRFDVLLSNFIKKLLAWADVIYIPRFWYAAIPVAKAYGKPITVHIHDYIPICPLATRYNLSKNEVCERSFCFPSCILAHERAHGKSFLKALISSLLNLAVWPYIGRLITLSDAVICVSNAQRNMIVAHMPSLAQKCHVIHNPLPKISALEINGKDMGYFGGPSPLKGFNVLCQALKHVRSKVTIHATGFNFSSQSLVMLSSRSRIIFYERLPKEHYKKIYRGIHTVLVPSIWLEPSPYVVCEALLSRRILIASKIGGIPELVEGCPGVFLFQPGDYKRLAELIEYVNNLDEQTILDLGNKNREAFLKRFNNERSLRKFLDLLKTL